MKSERRTRVVRKFDSLGMTVVQATATNCRRTPSIATGIKSSDSGELTGPNSLVESLAVGRLGNSRLAGDFVPATNGR